MTVYEGVFKFLDCSTSHVTPADLNLLITSKVLLNYPYREGHFVYSAGDDFQETMKAARAAGFSDGMIKVLEYAHQAGCWWARLDADGTEFEFLPTYEAEWGAAPADTSFTVTMSSDEYHNKDFRYENLESTLIGLRGLLTKDKLLDDYVERTFTIRKAADLEVDKQEDPIAVSKND